MTANQVRKPDEIAAFTVVVLNHEDSYLLLQRSPTKMIWPGRWTGVGGRVEENEFGDLTKSALRELLEETGIHVRDVQHFTLRRILVHTRQNMPLTLLLYFTGVLPNKVFPHCSEGILDWVLAEDIPKLNVIGSTRPVLPLLVEDCKRNPEGSEEVSLGVVKLYPDGEVERILWI